MRLPIDTHGLRFLAVAPARRQTEFEADKPEEERKPRTTKEGEILYTVRLVAMGGGDAQVIRVTHVGDPKVSEEQPVEVSGLTAFPWEMGERSGVSFRADRIAPKGASAKPAGQQG
jgi:hypothetical protein